MAEKLKITSDGTFLGTTVTMPDGTPVPGITALTFTVGPWEIGMNHATLEVEGVDVELLGECELPAKGWGNLAQPGHPDLKKAVS